MQTAHLQLVVCELVHFEAILTEPEQLASLLGVTVFPQWYDFPGVAGIEAVRYSYEYLKAYPDTLGWGLYLLLHHKDRALVGMGGYKGKANAEGVVEIGYAIIPAYQGQGLATEAASALIDHAFSHEQVRRVEAHTLPERNASARVLEKAGMQWVGVVQDPDDGEIWHWSLRREDYARG